METTGRKQYLITNPDSSQTQLILNADGSVAMCLHLPVVREPLDLFADLSLEVSVKNEYLPEVGEQCPVWS